MFFLLEIKLMIKSYASLQVISEMTGGGADYCFECIGLASLMQSAYESSRKVCFHLKLAYIIVKFVLV